MDAFIDWIVSTRLSWFVTEYRWVWPISESVHFCGLTLLAGTVGLFDLRVLGPREGHRPGHVACDAAVGPRRFRCVRHHRRDVHLRHTRQYFYNDAFKLKVVLLVLMGANAALFYWREFAGIRTLGPHDDAPRSTKIVAAASLVFLVGVMLCGRMITFFRPPFLTGAGVPTR